MSDDLISRAAAMELRDSLADIIGARPMSSIHSALSEYRKALAALPAQPAQGEAVAWRDYDAGLLNDYGGGNVDLWQDYILAEIGRANIDLAALTCGDGSPHPIGPIGRLRPSNVGMRSTAPETDRSLGSENAHDHPPPAALG